MFSFLGKGITAIYYLTAFVYLSYNDIVALYLLLCKPQIRIYNRFSQIYDSYKPWSRATQTAQAHD